jgi:DNA-directed RNA polymerase subunit RPC12/RpoP
MSHVYRCIRCYAEIGEKTFMWHCPTCRIQDTMKEVAKKSSERRSSNNSNVPDHMIDTFRRMGIYL